MPKKKATTEKAASNKPSATVGQRRVTVTDSAGEVISETVEWLPALFVDEEFLAKGVPLAHAGGKRAHRVYARKNFGGHYDVEVSVHLPCLTTNVKAALEAGQKMCLEVLAPEVKKVDEAFARKHAQETGST